LIQNVSEIQGEENLQSRLLGPGNFSSGEKSKNQDFWQPYSQLRIDGNQVKISHVKISKHSEISGQGK
jgi:hypothetical protein